MKPISNVEFMLLHLLSTEGGLSGYDINKLVERYGFREWADIGTTSIYVSLTKLEKKELVSSTLDKKKTGKGPPPKIFSLVAAGRHQLKKEIKNIIPCPTAKPERFKLSLVAIKMLTKTEMVTVFNARKKNLTQHVESLNTEHFLPQGGLNLPNNVRWTFQHSLSIYNTEIQFTQLILNELNATEYLAEQEKTQ